MPKKKITFEKLAQMVAKGFEETATKNDLKKLEGRMTTMEGRMTTIENKMVTKDDLERTEEKLFKQITGLKGDLILVVRKEDKKLETLIKILSKKNILSKTDLKEISQIRVFPRIEIAA